MSLLKRSTTGNLHDSLRTEEAENPELDRPNSTSSKNNVNAIGRLVQLGLWPRPSLEPPEEPELHQLYTVRSKLGGWLP